MKRTVLLLLMFCLALSAFAQKPEGALSYQSYPETGFEAWSFTDRNLPDEIYTADMCIVSECVGYFPCTAFVFSDARNTKYMDFKIYRIMTDGTVLGRYFVYEDGTYITDHDLTAGEVFVFRSDDGAHEIYVQKIYREKVYPESGFRAFTYTGERLPDDISIVWMCIQSDCAGDVPCTVIDFGDEEARTDMKIYRIKNDGSEGYRYFKIINNCYIADTILEPSEMFVLRTFGRDHEIYISLI